MKKSLLMFAFVLVSAEAMLHNCRMLSCPVNDTVFSSAAYAINTTRTYYEPRKPVTVIVSPKQCPKKKKQPGPEWYKIEVIDSDGAVAGKFVKPTQRSEDRSCDSNTKLVFRTCEPVIMHDLPRKHVWRTTRDVGQVCFRITLHTKGDNRCEVIKHCIHPKGAAAATTNVSTSNSVTETPAEVTNISDITALDNSTTALDNATMDTTNNASNETIESSGALPTMPTTAMPTTAKPTKKPTEKRSTDIIDILIGSRRRRANRSKRCRQCPEVNSDAEKVCGTDGVTYNSKCHLQRKACLSRKLIQIDYYGKCRKNPPTNCERDWGRGRLPHDDWHSGCDCFGYFKARQCYLNSITGKYNCWCSDESGYEIAGTRKTFTCLEKLTAVMNCF